MALRFQPPQQNQNSEPSNYDQSMNSFNRFSDSVGNLGKTFEDLAILKQKKEHDAKMAQMEQMQSNYKYGTPMSPEEKNSSVGTPSGMAHSSFMPQSQNSPSWNQLQQVGIGMPFVDAFNKFRAGGLKTAQAQPDFISYLGEDERKQFYENANPKQGSTYSPEQMNALFSGEPNSISKTFPGGVPKEAASMAAGISGRQASLNNTSSNQTFDNEISLQNKFLNESKDFKDTATSYQRILDSAKDPSAAGDLALIFNYMKMLDPGSTVREGEFANAQNSGGIPDVLQARYNSVINGERLNQDIRNDFLNRSGAIYKGQEGRHNQREQQYTQIANNNRFNPKNVVIDLKVKQPQAGGVIPTIHSQQEYDALPSGSEYIDSYGTKTRKS